MKKLLIFAAFALMIGIYAFQNAEQVSMTTEDVSSLKPASKKRLMASIRPDGQMHMGGPSSEVGYNPTQLENETINCLNYDGDDVCQDYNSVPESYPEDTYAQTEVDSQPVEEPAMQDFEETNPSEYEREADNALFASAQNPEE